MYHIDHWYIRLILWCHFQSLWGSCDISPSKPLRLTWYITFGHVWGLAWCDISPSKPLRLKWYITFSCILGLMWCITFGHVWGSHDISLSVVFVASVMYHFQSCLRLTWCDISPSKPLMLEWYITFSCIWGSCDVIYHFQSYLGLMWSPSKPFQSCYITLVSPHMIHHFQAFCDTSPLNIWYSTFKALGLHDRSPLGLTDWCFHQSQARIK
jgi:hypothetical protein